VLLLEIGVGKREEHPAVLIVGGVHPPHLVGSELAVRLARRLPELDEGDKEPDGFEMRAS
jgi:predicted deacylase